MCTSQTTRAIKVSKVVSDYNHLISGKCQEFISTFQDPTISRANEDPIHGKLKYMIQLQKIANREKRTDTKTECVHNILEISLQDLKEFFDSVRDMGFVERVRINTSRYISIFSQVIDSVMPQPTRQLGEDEQSTFDIVMQQRRFNAANSH